MRHHVLTSFEIQKYYQNEPKFNGVKSSVNLMVLINIGKYKTVRTHWIALYVNRNNVSASYHASRY